MSPISIVRVTALCLALGLATQFSTAAPPALAPKAVVPTPPQGKPLDQGAHQSTAEKIANTRDAISRATRAIKKIQDRLDDPAGEYKKAEAEFEAINSKVKDAKHKVATLKKGGQAKEAATAGATLAGLEEDWTIARERFDIAIRQRQASLEALEGLKARVAGDQLALDRLEGKKQTPPGSPAAPPVAAPDLVAPPSWLTPETGGGPVPRPELAAPAAPGAPAAPAATTHTETHHGPDDDPAVRAAREQLDTRRAEQRDAEARVRSAEQRVRAMERSIQSTTKNEQLARETVAQAEKAAARIVANLRTQPEGPERDALVAKQKETEGRLAEAAGRVKSITDRVARFNESLAELKDDLNFATKEAADAKQRVADAEAELNGLVSPTAPRNLFRWVLTKAPRVLMILFGIVAVHLVGLQFSRHIVQFITRNSDRGSPEDRENRAHTLVGVFRYAAGLVVFGGGMLMLLDEVGVPVVPLMGGAAVVGLAVAFGAQNLIRDYFTGFMMLMEDQYSVNDVVRIGTISGRVEHITLRMTVLRDLEGIRHFIPHGTVTSVSNLTHGWSRARLDIPVAYKENVDRVIQVLVELGNGMRKDEVFGKHIVEDPEMLGVEELADSAVIVRFLLKTRPLQQWGVRRELLRRIKNRFDELGIEIPLPQRTVYHRYEEGAGPAADQPASARRVA